MHLWTQWTWEVSLPVSDTHHAGSSGACQDLRKKIKVQYTWGYMIQNWSHIGFTQTLSQNLLRCAISRRSRGLSDPYSMPFGGYQCIPRGTLNSWSLGKCLCSVSLRDNPSAWGPEESGCLNANAMWERDHQGIPSFRYRRGMLECINTANMDAKAAFPASTEHWKRNQGVWIRNLAKWPP